MFDPDTFLTALYVAVDTIDQSLLPAEPSHPGPRASLARSEVITLSMFGQWMTFPSERAFYRYADQHLRPAFPQLPSRPQFNRLVRWHLSAQMQCAVVLGQWVQSQPTHEVLDGMGVPIRNCKRRGRSWLAGEAGLSWSNRVGYYYGFHLLTVVSPQGAVTGFGFGPGPTNERSLAETLFSLRDQPDPALPSVGQTRTPFYVADSGFGGRKREHHWATTYHIQLVCSPQRDSARRWPRPLRRWVAGIRQIVETVHHRLLHWFRLDRERPHTLTGFSARLAAKIGLHNFCLWLNRQCDQPLLACADLIDW